MDLQTSPVSPKTRTNSRRSLAYFLVIVLLCRSTEKVQAFAAPGGLRSWSNGIRSGIFSSSRSEEPLPLQEPSSTDLKDAQRELAVPRTMGNALHLFWATEHYHGPRWVVFSLAALLSARLALPEPLTVTKDGAIFFAAVTLWCIQEHVIHGKLLHSKWDWLGKQIHTGHHAKPYYHVAIDPAPLLLGWLWSAFVLFQLALPSAAIAVTATLGYACAGLFYEWTHFIVHTRVRFKRQSPWRTLQRHHMQHHLVDNRYWLSFSVPAVDSLFRTRPTVQEALRRRRQEEEECK